MELAARVLCYLRPIDSARRIGASPALPVTLVVVALTAAVASAAPRTAVIVKGPRHAHTGGGVRLHFSGHAPRGVRRLFVLLDNRRCAAHERDEVRRPELRGPVRLPVHGSFKAVLTIRHSAKGTHYVCAYLVRSRRHRTVGMGTWRYLTS